MTTGLELAQIGDLRLGRLLISPSRRKIAGPYGEFALEPLVMQLLVQLAGRQGSVVTRRELFVGLWGNATVGDDSLNRLVAVLRRLLGAAGETMVQVETVPATGYALRLIQDLESPDVGAGSNDALGQAIGEGWRSWLLALPQPDTDRIASLRRALRDEPESAAGWGMLALLLRNAVEYADPGQVIDFLERGQRAAQRAFAIDPVQADARVALAGFPPLFGNWANSRAELQRILAGNPTHIPANHDLAMVEMATGRVSTAKSMIDSLRAREPLAAAFVYKSIYHHWTVNDRVGLDQIADRAAYLWPTHPAIWSARLWTLAFTDRVAAAADMLNDSIRPELPPEALNLYKLVIDCCGGAGERRELVIAKVVAGASHGPGQAIIALFALGLLGAVDDAFEVARAYYCRAGPSPVPIRRSREGLSITDQHRRVTQILFTPACARMRDDPRFLDLCRDIGLVEAWDRSGLGPDFLSA